MANLFGFDGATIIYLLTLGVYGVPIIVGFTYDMWYPLLILFGLMIFLALGIVISNPKKYLTVTDFY